MNRTILVIVVLSLLLFTRQEAWAQYSFLESQSHEDIGQIKSNIDDLLESNTTLTQEHADLKEELESLQIKVQQVKKKFGKLKNVAIRDREEYKMSDESLKILNGDVEQLQTEIMIRKGRQTFLKRQLMDINKKIDLWNLKRTELEYEKREYDIKQKSQNPEINQAKYDRIHHQLQRDIKQSQDKKEELLGKMEEIEQARLAYPHSLLETKRENERLERELADIQMQKEVKEKEVSILQDKKELAQLRFDQGYDDYASEHTYLKKEVSELENEYVQFNETVESSLSDKSKKRNIMQNIISLDKENQDMLNEIKKLQEALQNQ